MTLQKRPPIPFRAFKTYLCILILLLMTALTFAWETTVDKLHDGETFEVTRKGREIDVGFSGIDCPEKDQPYGMLAQNFVKKFAGIVVRQ